MSNIDRCRDNVYFKEATRFREFNILNLAYGQYDSNNKWDIPTIKNNEIDEDVIRKSKLIGFNFAKSGKNTKNKAIHFFLHDYQFERVWNYPERYLSILKQYNFVLSPDFSPYVDMPLPTKLFNLYRNRWVGRYWQENGIKVVPTITIGDLDNLDLYLAGVEKQSVIAISTMGEGRWGNYTLLYNYWDKIMDKLQPKNVILYGKDLRTKLNDPRIIYKPYCNSAK